MSSRVIRLDVGGTPLSTRPATLLKYPESRLALLAPENPDPTIISDFAMQTPDGFFVDRDGETLRAVLNWLRSGELRAELCASVRLSLRDEAAFLRLPQLAEALEEREHTSGTITVGYRGTFAFGRDGQADVKFRKLNRILVCGRSDLCREVFGESLNESRDADSGGEVGRYTSRVFLKHSSLEMALDALYAGGFAVVGAAGSGASSPAALPPPIRDSEELRWNHYNEFTFFRPP